MDYRNNKHTDAWDDGVFGTGNTSPPKSYSGIIALLLILVIFLSGIVSLLSFMNIKLFQQLTEQRKQLEDKSPMAFTDLEIAPTGAPADSFAPHHIQGDMSMQLNRSPQSVENVPEMGALSWQEIYEKNNPSVVSILTDREEGSVTGSGIIATERGYIITTCQMVTGAQRIAVTLSDGNVYDAQVVGFDTLTDLALIFIQAENLPCAEFGDSDALRVGDSVAILGGEMSGSLSNGIICAINRNVSFLGRDISLIQSSFALSPAGTGGPLINCYGQVVGIHSAQLGAGEDLRGAGYAIPSTTVKEVVDQLMSQGYVSGRPTLGLTGDAITPFDQAYFHIPQGLYLTDVAPGSEAYTLGIAPGDILISLEGEPITSQAKLDTFVFSHSIGDSLTAVLFRDGQEETVSLTVTEYAG